MMNDTCYFVDAPRHQGQDRDLWFVSKAFKCDKENVTRLHKLIHDAKSGHSGFMASPIVALTLMRSVQMNRKDIIQCLISEGASTNMLFRGRTMLHVAVKAQNVPMLSYLLTLEGVDKDKRDVEMVTPLMDAAQGKPACLKILLEAGCSMHARNLKGLTPFHFTIFASRAKREDVINCLDTFLAYGADIDVQDNRGENCLHKAIKMNNQWFIKWLILNNCNLNSCGPKMSLITGALPGLKIPKASPFLLAIQKANRVMVEGLIACGCDYRKYQNVLEFCKDYRLLHLSFQKALKNVESLQALCRKTIRQRLSTNIVLESAHLGLPTALQRYVLCIEELSVLDHFE